MNNLETEFLGENEVVCLIDMAFLRTFHGKYSKRGNLCCAYYPKIYVGLRIRLLFAGVTSREYEELGNANKSRKVSLRPAV